MVKPGEGRSPRSRESLRKSHTPDGSVRDVKLVEYLSSTVTAIGHSPCTNGAPMIVAPGGPERCREPLEHPAKVIIAGPSDNRWTQMLEILRLALFNHIELSLRLKISASAAWPSTRRICGWRAFCCKPE